MDDSQTGRKRTRDDRGDQEEEETTMEPPPAKRIYTERPVQLMDLPPEILGCIVEQCDDRETEHRLANVCKKLYAVVTHDRSIIVICTLSPKTNVGSMPRLISVTIAPIASRLRKYSWHMPYCVIIQVEFYDGVSDPDNRSGQACSPDELMQLHADMKLIAERTPTCVLKFYSRFLTLERMRWFEPFTKYFTDLEVIDNHGGSRACKSLFGLDGATFMSRCNRVTLINCHFNRSSDYKVFSRCERLILGVSSSVDDRTLRFLVRSGVEVIEI